LSRPIRFHGNGLTLFGIQITNICLNMVTLGIYSFWGRVKVRAYLMSQTEFESDRFGYHGTGKELFIGWLKAMLFFGVPFIVIVVLQVLAGPESGLFALMQLLIYLLVGLFIPVAMVNARRYRLSRTSWRNIRFSFRGGVGEFIGIYLKGWLLTAITLGCYYPYWQNRRQGFMIGNSFFGNQKFEFGGQGKDLLVSFILHLFLTFVTFGLNWLWYWARVQRYYAEHTRFQQACFRSTVTGGGILGLWLVNGLLLLVTLGFAWSWIIVRNVRYYVDHLVMTGPLDLATVMQEAQSATAVGEGLSGFLDLDFDIG
jgi:uncharacterized membrane protein YjgN (DUF898 family)